MYWGFKNISSLLLPSNKLHLKFFSPRIIPLVIWGVPEKKNKKKTFNPKQKKMEK